MKNQYTEDLLDRQRTINKWTERFIKNGKNLVLAVHAEWGMGKTFFAKQRYEYLKNLNYPFVILMHLKMILLMTHLKLLHLVL